MTNNLRKNGVFFFLMDGVHIIGVGNIYSREKEVLHLGNHVQKFLFILSFFPLLFTFWSIIIFYF